MARFNILGIVLAMALVASPALAQRPATHGGGGHASAPVSHAAPAQRPAPPAQQHAAPPSRPPGSQGHAVPRPPQGDRQGYQRGGQGMRGGRQEGYGYRPYGHGPHGRNWFYGGRYWMGYYTPWFYEFGPRIWFFDDGFWYPYPDIVVSVQQNDTYAHVAFGPFPLDAEVFVDGKTHGLLTQINTLGLTPGQHTITIHASDQEWQYTINLNAGETITIRHQD